MADKGVSDDHDLMAFPELYRHGREGRWFGLKLFGVFMFEGVYQVFLHPLPDSRIC